MSSPTISVIMSEYNTKTEYLISSIKSILVQSYSDFEFIIVDDCGDNDVKSIVKEFKDKRIRIIKNKQNMGLVYSLNTAIDHARGKYLVRMDTDDIALPDRIEKLYNFIADNPKYAVVGSRVFEFSGSQIDGVLGKKGEKTKKSIMRGDVPVHPSVIINADIIRQLKGYDNYDRAEDLALWCKLILNDYKIFVINDILLKYRVNITDYEKRKLNKRKGEINARLYYYPKMGASLIDHMFIVKSIISGILPAAIVKQFRHKVILSRSDPFNVNIEEESI